MSTFWIATGFVLVCVLLLLALSILFIESGSVGAVFRFGKFRRALKPGLNFIIPILERVERYSTQTHQHELPDEPENIDRGDVLSEGKKHPYRIMHPGKEAAIFYKKKDSTDPSIDPARPTTHWKQVQFADLDQVTKASLDDSLHVPLTSEISVVVEWHLENSDRQSVENFIQNVSPEEGRTREEEVRKRIDDAVSTALQGYLGPVTLGHVRGTMSFFSMLIKERVEVLVGEKSHPDTGLSEKPWGIHIRDAYIKSISAGNTVNTAQSNASAAVSEKQKTILGAEARAEATRVQSVAEMEAEINKGKGEAGRIKAMAEAMSSDDARFVAALDVAEKVMPGVGTTVILPAGETSAIGSVLAAIGGNMAKKQASSQEAKK